MLGKKCGKLLHFALKYNALSVIRVKTQQIAALRVETQRYCTNSGYKMRRVALCRPEIS
jgi:hypothetical protein